MNENISDFSSIIADGMNRRVFLKTTASVAILSLFHTTGISKMAAPVMQFTPVAASSLDRLIVPPEYDWDVLVSWGDPIIKGTAAFNERMNTAADQAGQFGDNNDGMSFFPLMDKTGSPVKNRAVMAINNEYHNPEYLFAHGDAQVKSSEDTLKSQAASGVSIIEVQKNNQGRWQLVKDSSYNRRITGNTPMVVVGPLAGHPLMRSSTSADGKRVVGTFNNCANGQTPWGTYLTCEENFNGYFGASNADYKTDARQKRYGLSAKPEQGREWYLFDERFDLSKNPENAHHYGWVVEIDPMDPTSTPKKLTALGRFMHENAAITINKDGRVVVYMGDDSRGEFIYRFVSAGTFDASNPGSAKNKALLENGTLYVAKFYSDVTTQNTKGLPVGTGEWLPLVYGMNGLTPENGFNSQEDVLCFARLAASKVGATTMDRPEWVAIDPRSGDIYVTLTNNKNRGTESQPVNAPNPREKNHYGHIVRITQDQKNYTSSGFGWDLFVMAGNPKVHPGTVYAGSKNITKDNMFNSPDGIGFDAAGRLWIQSDGDYSNAGNFEGMGNNQMLCADTVSGEIKRFLVGPVACEITGIAFSPDYKTMFINIQHPGENLAPSTFPHGQAGKIPRSSVIAIYKKDGGVIGS